MNTRHNEAMRGKMLDQLSHLVEIVAEPKTVAIRLNVLRTIANVTLSGQISSDALRKAGAIGPLSSLLQQTTVKEDLEAATFSLCNISFENVAAIRQMLDNDTITRALALVHHLSL